MPKEEEVLTPAEEQALQSEIETKIETKTTPAKAAAEQNIQFLDTPKNPEELNLGVGQVTAVRTNSVAIQFANGEVKSFSFNEEYLKKVAPKEGQLFSVRIEKRIKGKTGYQSVDPAMLALCPPTKRQRGRNGLFVTVAHTMTSEVASLEVANTETAMASFKAALSAAEKANAEAQLAQAKAATALEMLKSLSSAASMGQIDPEFAKLAITSGLLKT